MVRPAVAEASDDDPADAFAVEPLAASSPPVPTESDAADDEDDAVPDPVVVDAAPVPPVEVDDVAPAFPDADLDDVVPDDVLAPVEAPFAADPDDRLFEVRLEVREAELDLEDDAERPDDEPEELDDVRVVDVVDPFDGVDASPPLGDPALPFEDPALPLDDPSVGDASSTPGNAESGGRPSRCVST